MARWLQRIPVPRPGGQDIGWIAATFPTFDATTVVAAAAQQAASFRLRTRDTAPRLTPDGMGWVFTNLPPAFNPIDAVGGATQLFSSFRTSSPRPSAPRLTPDTLGWISAAQFPPALVVGAIAETRTFRTRPGVPYFRPDAPQPAWIFTALPVMGTPINFNRMPMWRRRLELLSIRL